MGRLRPRQYKDKNNTGRLQLFLIQQL